MPETFTQTAAEPVTGNLMERMRQQVPAIAAAQQPIPHDELIHGVAAHLKPIDFRQVAGLPNDGRVTNAHHVLYTVKQVLAQLAAEGFPIGRINGGAYLYNRAFWKALDKDDAKTMLTEAALTFGVPEVVAESSDFKKEAVQQLIDSCGKLRKPNRKGLIKINTQNGTVALNTTTGEATRLPFDPDDLMRYQLPFAYDPEATAPDFDKFLRQVQPDESVRKVMQEWHGYTYLPHGVLNVEKTMIYYGHGANGKSVMFEVIMAMLGPENTCSVNLEALTTKDTSRGILADKLINYASEISRNLKADAFKTLSSGEPIEAKYLYKDPFIMTDYAKLQFNCNELPKAAEYTHGYERRFLIVPFGVTIAKEKQDRQLKGRIIANELPGVFNWTLEGMKRIIEQEGNFTGSDVIDAAAKKHQENSDTILRFLKDQEMGYTAHDTNLVYGNAIFDDYKAWCVEENCRYDHITRQIFYERLESKGIKQAEKPGSGGVRFYATKNNKPF